MIRRTALLALTAVFAALAGCSPAEAPPRAASQEITFAILTVESAHDQEALWKPFLADMEMQTGLKVKPFYASNYTSLVEAMSFKQVQAGWFSSQAGLDAVRRAGGEVFARASDRAGGDGDAAHVLVRADSGLTLEDVTACDRKLAFGLGDARSTSATLAPLTYLFGPRGIDPQKCFKIARSANPEANLRSVADGVLDAGTAGSIALRRARPDLIARVKIIWTSPPLPHDPIVWRKDLDPATKEKIRSFFLSYGVGSGPAAERQRAVLEKLSFGPFEPADDGHLLPAREMEAAEALYEARASGDRARIAKSEQAVQVVARERAAREARTAEVPSDIAVG